MALLWTDSKPPKIKEVPKYVEIPDYIYVMPALPECASFNFNPEIGGMSGSELILFTANLYHWGAHCSNAIFLESIRISDMNKKAL